MAVSNPSSLKLRFLDGSVPTCGDFCDLIDSGVNNSNVAAFYTAIKDKTGFVKVDPNYNFTIKGGSILKQILQTETTASVNAIFNVVSEVKVSADFKIQGTAGVTATGDLNSGITIGLLSDTTPKWIKGGNRVNVTDRGKLTSINRNYSDYNYSFYVNVLSTTKMTIIHPDFASARKVDIFCSALSHSGTTSQLQFRLVKSTSQSILDDYNTRLAYDFGQGFTSVTKDHIFIQNSAESTAGSKFNLLACFNPLPRGKGMFIDGSIYKEGASDRSAFFSVDIAATNTAKGFALNFSNGNKFNTGGIIRVGIR